MDDRVTDNVDQAWMQRALACAEAAGERDEVPVGAVVVSPEGVLLGEAGNQQIGSHDPTAHAEVLALRSAAAHVGNYRLPGCTLYVTLEPCTMCCGAMVHARVERLVFATREPKSGAVVSTASLLDTSAFNHRVTWEEGPLAEASSRLLQAFFARRRAESRAVRG